MVKVNHTNDPVLMDWVEFIENNPDLPRTDLPTCLGRNFYSGDCVLFNIEQNTRNDFNFGYFLDRSIVEIWDYSLKNIEIFKEKNITNVKHVPFRLLDDYKKKLFSYNMENEYEYDVVFVSWKNARRNIILNELIDKGVKLTVIPNDRVESVFGEERDKIISNSKILLNIHYGDDYKIFESYRCFPWIETGKIVVSENSLDNDNRCINVDYDNIVNTIIKLTNK